nr:uncharacterized protein LOC109193110 [Ipomoea batatas]
MEEAMEVAGSPKSQELSLEVHESGCEGGGLRSSKALVIMVCQKRGSLEGGDVAVGGSPSEAIWIPPPPNRIKCNVDAAVYGDGAGLGLIAVVFSSQRVRIARSWRSTDCTVVIRVRVPELGGESLRYMNV